MKFPDLPIKTGLRALLAIGLLAAGLGWSAQNVEAREGDRTLRLYFGHTKERATFTFKRNGRYDKGELKRINHFLRDWRRNEDANLDPHLLDLVWSIYQEVGATQEINVVSAYRSLKTNNMLRSRSKGVAKTSQHTAGKAMDFFIPGVPLAKLRATAMKFQGGGVGYYPTSGSPFVHVDTGNVRAWPRMTRSQLVALFPNGNTLHLPADGKPLPGYERALAARKSGETQLAYLEPGSGNGGRSGGSVSGWLKRVFDGGADQAEDDAESGTATAPEAAPEAPATAATEVLVAAAEEASDARLPKSRPQTSAQMMVASADLAPEPEAPAVEDAVAVNTPLAAPPAPNVPRSRPDSTVLVASLDTRDDPAALSIDAEDAIASLAARMDPQVPETPEVVVAAAPTATGPLLLRRDSTAAPSEVRMASLDGNSDLGTDALQAATALAALASRPPVDPKPPTLAFVETPSRAAPPETDRTGTQPLPAAPPAAVAAAPATNAPRVVGPAPLKVNVAGVGVAPTADAPQAAAQPAAVQSATVQPAVTTPAPAADVVATTATEPMQEARKGDLMAQPETEAAPRSSPPSVRVATLSAPQPADAPGLYTAPENASTVIARAPAATLPTLRFQHAAPAAPPAEEQGFFSKLLAKVMP